MTEGMSEGWYADPTGGDWERYWNGTAWTTEIRETGERPQTPEGSLVNIERQLIQANKTLNGIRWGIVGLFAWLVVIPFVLASCSGTFG